MRKVTKVPAALTELADVVNELSDQVKPIRVGAGLKLTEAKANKLISLDPEFIRQQIVAGSTFYHPFKVVLTTPATPSVNIIAESRLYSALSPAATLSITSLTSAITLTSTTKIWLKGTVNSSLVTTAASITTTNPTNLMTFSGSTQTEWHVLIGKVASGANSDAPGFDFQISGVDYHFEQTCFNHLLIEYRCNSGNPSVYPFAFTGD